MRKPGLVWIAALAVVSASCGGPQAEPSGPPTGLMVELMSEPAKAKITDPLPEFGWIVHSPTQTAYRILVASSRKWLDENEGNVWDSGKVESDASINVEYGGKKGLEPGTTYHWKVMTWCRLGGPSPWSEPQEFVTAGKVGGYETTRYPLERTPIAPRSLVKKGEGHYLADFGRVAFGYLTLDLESPDDRAVEIHFGERGDENGVNRNPEGTVRYYKVDQACRKGKHGYEVHPPQDKRNTGKNAIGIPEEIGVIAPFRYVEIVNCPAEPDLRQISAHYRFDSRSSSFESSDLVLNDVWDLCKYSMKATSFCGVYVDGDRERIPYEADAYINQLSHYAVDREYTLARYTHEYLLTHPTWPTEWKQHSVLMAWADYMYTGNSESLAQNYGVLRSEKTLEQRARPDGLLDTKGLRDIVDWPKGERDDYDFRDVNTVVNAFHCRTLQMMTLLARALRKQEDAAEYEEKLEKAKAAFQKVLFDEKRGLYVDGEGSDHVSLHANMMPLAFGLVPEDRIKGVADYVVSRGMACSVYGAQYLLEGLYNAGRPDAALALMTSKEVRSWHNMIRVGSTITLEAWDNRFKENQDWNHAWGAAPGNIIARCLMGVRPMLPGFRRVFVMPQPGGLERAAATIPTIRGPIKVAFENRRGGAFALEVTLPGNTTATVGVPVGGRESPVLTVDGERMEGEVVLGYLFVDAVGYGTHNIVRE